MPLVSISFNSKDRQYKTFHPYSNHHSLEGGGTQEPIAPPHTHINYCSHILSRFELEPRYAWEASKTAPEPN